MEIKFAIDEETYIAIPLEAPVTDLTMCDRLPAYLIHKNHRRYAIYNSWDDVWSGMHEMSDSLKAALAGELEPPQGWHNMGYIWNEYLQHIQLPPEYNMYDENKFWVGSKYTMWCPGKNPSTLLYNRNREIIFQIVPVYREFINKIPYAVFIRNYRNYMTRIIPRATAQKWLETATGLIDSMFANYECAKKRMESESTGQGM